MLGPEGQGFAVAQTRLGGGRVHHAMRAVATCQRALDMMCERAISRTTKGSLLADKQYVQGYIADSWIELQQYRLMVLQTAWKIDRYNDYQRVREDIAGIKVAAQKILHDIVGRAIQVHGALGISNEMPLWDMYQAQYTTGLLRRAERGAQDHRGPAGAEEVRGRPPACGPPSTFPPGARTPRPGSTRSSRSSAPSPLPESRPRPLPPAPSSGAERSGQVSTLSGQYAGPNDSQPVGRGCSVSESRVDA